MIQSLKKIPIKIKLTVYSICLLIFIILNFTPASYVFIYLIDFLHELTGAYLMISINTLLFLIISVIPFFGMLYHSTRKNCNRKEFIIDALVVICSVISVFCLGLILQGIFGSSSNPLIPNSLKGELLPYYSTILLIAGIGLPFALLPKNNSKN